MALATSSGRPPRYMGNQCLDAIDTFRFAPFGVQLRVDKSRPHGIHTDALLRDFLRQADGERLDSALALAALVHVFAR